MRAASVRDAVWTATTIGVTIEIRTGLAKVAARATYLVIRPLGAERAIRAATRVAYRLAKFRVDGGKWQRFEEAWELPTARTVRS